MNLNDTEIWTLCKLGYQLFAREKYRESAKIFRGVLALDSTRPYPWHALGLIAKEQGDLQRAVDCFQKRLELEPEADDTRVSLAETLYEHGYKNDAVEVLQPLTHKSGADAQTAAVRRGRVLLKQWTGR